MNTEYFKQLKAAVENKLVKLNINETRDNQFQVEFRDINDGSLIWRMWNFESDFDFYLAREIDHLKDKPAIEAVAISNEWDNEENCINAERVTLKEVNENVFIEIFKQTLSNWLTDQIIDVRYIVSFNNSFIECESLSFAYRVLESFEAVVNNKENAFKAVEIMNYKNASLCKNELLDVATGEILTTEYQVYVNGFLKVAGNDYQSALNVYSFEKVKQDDKPDHVVIDQGKRVLIDFDFFMIAVNVSTNKKSANCGKWYYIDNTSKLRFFDSKQLAVASAVNNAIANFEQFKIKG